MKKLLFCGVVTLQIFINNSLVWALAAKPNADPNAPPPPAWVTWGPLIFMFVVFYFLLIRPQSKQRRERQTLLNNVKKGDRIVTQGGFYATVVNVGPGTLEIKLNEETKVKIQRSAVAEIIKEDPSIIPKEAVPTS